MHSERFLLILIFLKMLESFYVYGYFPMCVYATAVCVVPWIRGGVVFPGVTGSCELETEAGSSGGAVNALDWGAISQLIDQKGK